MYISGSMSYLYALECINVYSRWFASISGDVEQRLEGP